MNAGKMRLVNHFNCTVLRLKPLNQMGKHSDVHLGHYSCLLRKTSLVASQLAGIRNIVAVHINL
jgi:hypothetical protein